MNINIKYYSLFYLSLKIELIFNALNIYNVFYVFHKKIKFQIQNEIR